MPRKPPTPRGCSHVCIGGARECAESTQAVCESWGGPEYWEPLADDARCGCGCHYTEDGLVAHGKHKGEPAPEPGAVPGWLRCLYEALESTKGCLEAELTALTVWKPVGEYEQFYVDSLRYHYNLVRCATCGWWYDADTEHCECTITTVAAQVMHPDAPRQPNEPSSEAHVDDPSCWCEPEEIEPGLWVHNRVKVE